MYGESAISQAGMSLAYQQPKVAAGNGRAGATWEAAKDFEAVFISSMIQPMFDSLETDGMFGGGQGEKVFRSMMVQEYGRKMVDAGGIGLADKVYEVMLKAQEGA
ncbi:MAG: rod-binding protein [Rhodospirillales bacterium]